MSQTAASALSCVLLFAGFVLSSARAADDSAFNTNQVRDLIARLSAPNYRDRQAAFTALRSQSRAIIPLLQAHAESPDPELSSSVLDLIRDLNNDPTKIPQRFYVFTETIDDHTDDYPLHKKWAAAVSDWVNAGVLCVSNLTGTASGRMRAQSFIPHCDHIVAAMVSLNPIGSAWGWVRLDLCADAAGRPGSNTLARCWIRVETNCPAAHSSFLVFRFPDTTLIRTATYWLEVREFPDPQSRPKSHICSVGLSKGDRYPEGECIDERGNSDRNWDITFGVLSKAPQFPLLRQATADELSRFPKPPIEREVFLPPP